MGDLNTKLAAEVIAGKFTVAPKPAIIPTGNKLAQAREITSDEWSRLVRDGLSDTGPTNTRFPFSVMSKKFGLAWIEYCKISWLSNEGCLTEIEFCEINGGIPSGFFQKHIKGSHV